MEESRPLILVAANQTCQVLPYILILRVMRSLSSLDWKCTVRIMAVFMGCWFVMRKISRSGLQCVGKERIG